MKRSPASTRATVRAAFPSGIDKLEIGAGSNPEKGYVTLDIQTNPKLDILSDVRKMPLPDNFVTEEIRAVHIMEHFCHPEYSSQQMRRNIGTTTEVLAEVYRVLAPGARFIMVTPDIEKIAESLQKQRIPAHWCQRWSVGGH